MDWAVGGMLSPHHSSSSAAIGQRRNCRKGWVGLFRSPWLCAFLTICEVSNRNLLAGNNIKDDITIIIPAIMIVEQLMISLLKGLLFIYIFFFPFFSCAAPSQSRLFQQLPELSAFLGQTKL